MKTEGYTTFPNFGFTLIELMISLGIGMVVIAGVVGMFVTQSRVQNSDVSRSEMLADMQVASQIIRHELHFAQDACQTNSNATLRYQPLDSTVDLHSDATGLLCDINDVANGKFELRSAGDNGCSTSSTSCICWDRPNDGNGCQELMRNIKATTGFYASKDSYGVVQVDLYGQYKGVSSSTNNKDIVTRITVYPRN